MFMRNPEGRRPFYLRTWFLVLGILFVLGAAGLSWFYFNYFLRYERKAEEFNLAKLGDLESASVVYDRHGNVFGKIFIQNREQVGLDQISHNLIDAVVSAEDNRFYEHSGVDFLGIFRAAVKNTQAGRIRQGASTLTQQLARNTFDLKDRTYDRKILEMFLAMRIEKTVPKDRIMELYLNRVYFGGGLYGAEAAARGYFGKPAKDLTIGEAAMLAGLLKSPNNLSPWHNLEAATANRDFVLSRMVENNKISAEQAKEAQSEPLQVRAKSNPGLQSYAIDYIRQQVEGELGFESLQSEGYRIYTTLDPDLQRSAEASLQRVLTGVESRSGYQHQTYNEYTRLLKEWRTTQPNNPNPPPPEYLQGAVMAVDNQTGSILAMVGGRDYGQSTYNRALQSKRPTGTAFTPLVFAAALDKGVFPGTLFEDSPIDNRQVMIGGTTGILGEWGVESPENRYEGPIPMRKILVISKNAASVRVGLEAGLDSVLKLAKRAGIQDDLRSYPSTLLGSSEVTLGDMVMAYTVFPGEGSRPDHWTVVTRIDTSDGKEVYRPHPSRAAVMDSQAAFEVHSFLSDALNLGTGAKARQEYGLNDFPAAGKTGTAYNFTDTWFFGYDSAITCGVWVGFDKPQMIYRGAFGNDLALPIWCDVMNASASTDPPRPLARPIDLKKVEVCLSTGLPASAKCALTADNSDDPTLPPRKGTFVEFSSAKQMPKETCWLHGEDRRSFVRRLKTQDVPRATTAVDTTQGSPVQMREPTLVGNDPYQTVKPRAEQAQLAQAKAGWTPAPRALPVVTPEPTVRRAEPVGPLDRQPGSAKVDLPPPEPIDLSSDPTGL
jgi:1A family penicillin-binding protein